jgi:uncharacterized protein (TIGR03118 family)
MPLQESFHSRSGATLAALVVALILTILPRSVAGQYKQFNLVTNVPRFQAHAIFRDPNLLNPWGIALSPTSPFWISDNHAGVSTLYRTIVGVPFPRPTPLVVTIPPPAGSSGPAAPTGIVFNGTANFIVSQGGKSGASAFIFATEDGTISGWSPAVDRTHAILTVDNSASPGIDNTQSQAIYKGLAISSDGGHIYATNFRDGVVEIYDGNFNFVSWFTDPGLSPDTPEPGFAPFGIQQIGGKLYVTFAMQDEDKEDDAKGPGRGFIDVFDESGTYIRRFASGGTLDSPWGVVIAPSNFGPFSNDLLVGNFGDGRINAFDPSSGQFLGQLTDLRGNPLAIEGLWGLIFGNGRFGQRTNSLFFTAGPNEENDGLFGRIQAIAAAQ